MDHRFVDLLAATLPLAGDREFPDDVPLRDLGLDSMLAVDLLFRIEEVFGVELADEELNDSTFGTARSLWTVVSAALPADDAETQTAGAT